MPKRKGGGYGGKGGSGNAFPGYGGGEGSRGGGEGSRGGGGKLYYFPAPQPDNRYFIEVRGLEEAQEMMLRFQPPELHRRLHRAMDRTVAKVWSEAVEDAPRDTGIGAMSMDTDVWEDDDGVWGSVFSPEVYMLVMEKGRRPASEIGLHPPPEHALDQWAFRHGYDEEVAERMRWSIAIKGIEPRPFLYPALVANVPFALNAAFEELMSE